MNQNRIRGKKNEHDSNHYNSDHLYHGGHDRVVGKGILMYHTVPREYTTADEINAYNRGFMDGYSNRPYHDYPDFQRFDNLRQAYAIGRSAGQLKRKEEVNGRIYQG